MKLTVIFNCGGNFADDQKFDAAVVLDVLRASSTITTALANGCSQLLPVAQVEQAVALAGEINTPLLGGERQAVKIPGFDLGNSPLEYSPAKVAGKKIILTTTNGTRAILQAAQGASVVMVGSLLNARTVAAKIAGYNSMLLLCAGTRGSFALEDALAAGWIIYELVAAREEGKYGHWREISMNDAGVAAYRLALYYRQRPLDALWNSSSGQRLAQLGMAADLTYCAQLNIIDLVPRYHQGMIVGDLL